MGRIDNSGAELPLPAAITADQAFFGHPRGLGFLLGTDAWVGFSYYGMQSLLVLYMTSHLLMSPHIDRVLGFIAFKTLLEHLYGPLSGRSLASAITGFYGALAFGTPMVGGLIADRLLGRTKSIVAGCLLMTIGHFLMAFDVSFVLALACLVMGTGLAGTMKAQVGGLYRRDDPRRGDAYQIYAVAFQSAVIAAPIVCGGLGERVAWHWGFGAAGVGMLIGLVVYLAGQRHMPPEPTIPRAKTRAGHEHLKMTVRDWRTMAILAFLVPIIAVAFIGNSEIFNGYLLWGKQNFQLELAGYRMPVSWLLSIDAFVSVGANLVVISFWRWWATRWRQPDEIVKIGAFGFIAALAPLVLAVASIQTAGGHKVGLFWGLGFHVINDIGIAGMGPIGLALFSRVAPPALGTTIVNAFTFATFLSNLLVGGLAGFLDTMPSSVFWSLHAALIAVAAGLLLVCARLFGTTLAPRTASCSA